MNLTDETTQQLIKSIDDLATQIYNVDLRLQALCGNLGTLSGAIRSSADSKKD